MSDEMSLNNYLAQGGKLTSPNNVPPRYRAQLMRMMASFVDSTLAGAAGFADIINRGPGVKERIAAARIVMEKTDHADRILSLMGTFGANTDRYVAHHPWTDRLDRNAKIGTERSNPDMRLAVFNYPLDGWADAVVMNLLMGKAVHVQLKEYAQLSYQPFAEAIRKIAPREQHHTELAEEGLAKLLETGTAVEKIDASVAYWWPRVASSFGSRASTRFDMLTEMGLRNTNNSELKAQWNAAASSCLEGMNIGAPTKE